MKAKNLFNVLLFWLLSFTLFSQISGKVYLDGNNDGTQQAVEVGFAGVTVTATPPSGPALTATTGTNGTYTISGTSSATTYRIEFTYPTGYADGAIGTQSETSVTFAAGNATNVDLGLNVPASCDPDGAIRVIFGSGLVSGEPQNTVRSWDYTADRRDALTGMGSAGTETPHTNDILDTQSGVPYGIAVQKGTNLAFYSTISSDLTNVFPTDPDGEGVIRVANYDGPSSTFVSMKKLLNFSAYGISTAAIAPTIDGTFGTHGLGGVAISDDGNYLYVINMGKRNIVRFDISSVNYSTLPSGGITGLPFVEIALPNPSCPNGVYRPGALEYYAGNLYLGGVCDANSGAATDLRAVFYRMAPSTNTFTQVLSYTPNFLAGGLRSIDWPHARWSSTYPSGDQDNDPGAIQPHIHSLAFDDTGSMIIGTVNREVYVNTGSDREPGYLMRTWREANGTFTLESGGVSGPYTSTGRMRNVDPGGLPGNYTPNPPSVTDNGPGGDWFFENGRTSSHPYLYNGGALVVPGTGYVVGGFADPGAPATQTGGRYLDLETGRTEWGTSVIGAKATVMSGSDAACADPTTEVGNRVWMDTDGDGIQDPDEMPISGVTVQLLNASGTVIATATTDAIGQYLFSSDTKTSTSSFIYGLTLTPGVNYTLRIPNVQGGSKQSALGTKSLTANDASGTTNTESDRLDSDGILVGNNADVTFQIEAYGANNHTFDFGFQNAPSCTLGVTCNPTPQSSCIPVNGAATTTVTGGQGTITYLWSSGETTSSISGKVAGTYTVTVTDDFLPGCTSTCQAVITSTVTLPTATCTPVANTNCTTPNGSASVTTNGNQILWSTGATTASITGLTADTYTVTVTNTTTGCTNTCQAVVTNNTTNPSVTCAKTDNSNCATPNGTATATATGVTYLWSNGETTASITGLAANTYTVTVTSTTTGCTATCSATVGSTTALPTATCTPVANTNCTTPNGSASVTTNGNQILWSTGATTASITGLTAATYTVTVTNTTTGCTNTCQAIVGSTTTLPTATCTPVANTNCTTPNGSASVTTNGNQILWSNGETTALITGLTAATYTVTVTNTTTGCTNACQAIVGNTTINPTCSITINSQPSCANLTGGSITVNPAPSGPTYSYSWSDIGSGPAMRSGLMGGTYTVTVTNTSTGCTGTCSQTLDTPMNCCNINAIVPQSLVCLDNGTPNLHTDNRIRFNANVTNTNATLTTYNVTINGGTTITPNNNVPYGITQFTLGPGTAGGGATFTVTVTDSVTPGCTQTFQVVDPGSCNNAVPCNTPNCGIATIQTNGN